MESIGARIKKKRLEKGFSLEDVQKKTKIHLNVLKAIEEDSIINLSPIYIKGFLKIYCKLLDVNPEEYVSGIKVKETVKVAETQKPAPEKESKPIASIKQNPVMPGIIKFIQDKVKLIIPIIIVIAVGIGLNTLGKSIISKIKPHPQKQKAGKVHVKKTQSSLPVIIPKHEIKTAPVKPRVVEVSAVKPPSLETTASLIKLGIRAKEDCWMQIKSDGKVIFQSNLKKGRFENWQAKEKIELSLGNAGVVELEVNGKIIPILGRRGQQIKNILITKDGLSTPR